MPATPVLTKPLPIQSGRNLVRSSATSSLSSGPQRGASPCLRSRQRHHLLPDQSYQRLSRFAPTRQRRACPDLSLLGCGAGHLSSTTSPASGDGLPPQRDMMILGSCGTPAGNDLPPASVKKSKAQILALR